MFFSCVDLQYHDMKLLYSWILVGEMSADKHNFLEFILNTVYMLKWFGFFLKIVRIVRNKTRF